MSTWRSSATNFSRGTRVRLSGVLLLTVYTVSTPRPSPLEFLESLPLEVQIDADITASFVTYGENGIRLLIRQRVANESLELVEKTGWYRDLPDGRREDVPALRVSVEPHDRHLLARDLVSTISFLTSAPLSISRPVQEDRLEAQGQEDHELLTRLGTDRPFSQGSVQVSSRTFATQVTPAIIEGLLARRAGVRLYADSLKSDYAVAQLRDLWRVLESAFGATNDTLVDLLSRFAPALDLGFDAQELHALLVLRGRASHAQSRAGVHELNAVELDCAAALPRLSNLAERVILTKKSWGHPTDGVEEMLPLQAYVSRG